MATTVYTAYAYSPRQGAMTIARDHAVVNGPIQFGRFHREAGDALCKPRRQFWGLEDTRDGREVTCPTCLDRMTRYGLNYGPHPETF